ncbi:MAG: ribosome silencing factor [Armatimonadetes bacterium RBG_16_58_9]|nr:MAG: ribosome silencing factor [Armatimonadetes bacterium RBG_16_58_9]
MQTEAKLDIIREILIEKKARDVEVMNLRERTVIADYFVVCTGTSDTHIKAVVDGLLVEGKAKGLRKEHVEGYQAANWVLIDYGDIIVHVFADEERKFYDIESLWRETSVRLESLA